jgi:addiction module HigA family antidote
MLLEEFLKPMGLTQQQLADGIHVPYQRVNELINGKRGVTPSTALRLARFFLRRESVILVFQLRAIDRKRIGRRLGKLDSETMSRVNAELKTMLGLDADS